MLCLTFILFVIFQTSDNLSHIVCFISVFYRYRHLSHMFTGHTKVFGVSPGCEAQARNLIIEKVEALSCHCALVFEIGGHRSRLFRWFFGRKTIHSSCKNISDTRSHISCIFHGYF